MGKQQERRVVLEIISRQIQLTKFMQAVDVFDRGHIIGLRKEMNITYVKDGTLSLSEGRLVQEQAAKAINASKERSVVFVHLVSVEDGEVLLKNIKFPPIYDMTVRQISDGRKWFMFKDYLKGLGFVVETDQHCYVTSLGFK